MVFIKKICIVITLLLLWICLIGCDNHKDSCVEGKCECGEEYFNLDESFFETTIYGLGEPPSDCLVDAYHCKKNLGYNIYDCKQEKRSLVAAYLDENTIEYLKGVTVSHFNQQPGHFRYTIGCLSSYIEKYILCVNQKMIDVELYPVKCKYVTKDNIPLIDGDKHLMFVFEETYFNSENIDTNEIKEFKVYDSVDGYCEGESFIINEDWVSNSSELNHIVIWRKTLSEYIYIHILKRRYEKVYNNKYIDIRKECLNYSRASEEFLSALEEIEIMEYTLNTSAVMCRYDYEKLLSFLRGV